MPKCDLSKKELPIELTTILIFCVFELLLFWLNLSFQVSCKFETLDNWVVIGSLGICKVSKLYLLRFVKKLINFWPFADFKTAKDNAFILSELKIQMVFNFPAKSLIWWFIMPKMLQVGPKTQFHEFFWSIVMLR